MFHFQLPKPFLAGEMLACPIQVVEEFSALLGPYQISMGADASRAIEREGACIRARAQVEVGAALRQSLVRQVSIEHVLPALIVLHMHLAERAVQFLRRASQLLGYLGGGVARDGIEHIVGIVAFGVSRFTSHRRAKMLIACLPMSISFFFNCLRSM